MKNNLKNHVAIVLDLSSSMQHLTDKMRKVFNNQIESLRRMSLQFEQETRVSVYTFADAHNIKCLISDVDVARPMELDSLDAYGWTALLDATGLAIEDLQLLPQKYGDHAFIVYLLTDGEENASRKYSPTKFSNLLSKLPDNFTVAAFVPDTNGVLMMERFGLRRGNIDKWDATEKGMEEVGQKFEKTMDNYFTMRSRGVRTSDTMFSDLHSVSAGQVKQILKKVSDKDYKIVINEKTQAVEIKPLVEDKVGVIYNKGNGFYELVKNERVQPAKKIAIQNKKTQEVFTGDQARNLLGLPNHEVKLCPADHGEWIVYVQSTSVNRKIIPKQRVLVFA
jgi:hypothetical protein